MVYHITCFYFCFPGHQLTLMLSITPPSYFPPLAEPPRPGTILLPSRSHLGKAHSMSFMSFDTLNTIVAPILCAVFGVSPFLSRTSIAHLTIGGRMTTNLYATPAIPVYKTWTDIAQSSKLYFDHSCLLHYIVYDYKLITIR